MAAPSPPHTRRAYKMVRLSADPIVPSGRTRRSRDFPCIVGDNTPLIDMFLITVDSSTHQRMSLPVKSMRPSAEKGKNEPGADIYLAAVGTTNASSVETYLTILGSVIERAPKPLLKLSPSEIRTLGAKLKESKSGYQYIRELRKFYRANKRKNL